MVELLVGWKVGRYCLIGVLSLRCFVLMSFMMVRLVKSLEIELI